MTSVWKRLQRVNKRAAKFQFTASYHRVDLETTSKWKPNKLSVVWSRRSRRVEAEPLDWEPSMKEPLKGSVIWAVPDNHNIAVTLFRDQRTNELEDKDWIFILEDVSSSGRRRKVAQVPVNLRPLASAGPSQKCLSLQMRPCTTKVTSASLEVTISSVLLREGSAADEDMQSMASMMSVNNNSDIAPLEDFEEDDYSFSDNSASLKQVLDMTQQMELMTSSLTGTPGSEASLSITPVAEAPSDPFIEQYKRDSYKLQSLPFDDNQQTNPFELPKLSINSSVQISKQNLKPLELKSNLNSFQYSDDVEENNSNAPTPIVDTSKVSDDKTPVPSADVGKSERGKLIRELSGDDSSIKDATPAQDLLEWCKEVTRDYHQCKVINLTTSWTNGIAFCAIIHHHRPDLIDMLEVSPDNPEGNIRMALRASDTLGVPGVFHPSEICRARGPDRLALLTYLHQLRALFTNRQLRLNKIGQTAEESSYIIGRFNTDKNSDISVELFSQEILSMRQKKEKENQTNTNRASLSSQDSFDSQNSQDRNTSRQALQSVNSPDRVSNNEATFQKEKSPISNVKDMKGMILASSKSILGRVLSPTKEKLQNIKSSFDNSKFGSKDSNENSNNKSNNACKDNNKNISYKENKKETLNTSKQDSYIKNDLSMQDNKLGNVPTMGITVRETWPVKLMTRKQLTDPFGSDEEDEEQDVLTVRVDEEKSQQPTLEMKEKSVVENNYSENQSQINNDNITLSPLETLPKPTQQLLSRHDELKEKARQLLEATRKEAREKELGRTNIIQTDLPANLNNVKEQNGATSPQKLSEDARQAQLRERARKLIADARAGLVSSPTSPPGRGGIVEVLSASQVLAEQSNLDYYKSPRNKSLESSPEKTFDVGKNTNSDIENNLINKEASDNSFKDSPTRQNFESGVNKSSSPLQSFNNIMDRISPDKESFIMRGFGKEMSNYIQSEMEALEREQSSIDKQAAILEKELRAVMESGQSDEEENALMVKWFTLVNKKNALLRRQMQLNILEQESELRARHAKVDGELRALLTVEEWRKSEGQRGDEARLLRELLNVVEARDQLVHHLHEHEQAIEDDDEIERNLSHVELKKKNNCFIQ